MRSSTRSFRLCSTKDTIFIRTGPRSRAVAAGRLAACIPVPTAKLQGADPWSMQVQCLLQTRVGNADNCKIEPCELEVQLRYLHLTQRTIGRLPVPCDELPFRSDPVYEAVDFLQLGGTRYQSWQEVSQRDATIGPIRLGSLLNRASVTSFAAPASHTLEPLRGPDGRIAAVAVCDQRSVEGSAEISIERLEESAVRVTVRIYNRSSLEDAVACSRDEALMRTLVAMHAVLIVRGGEFVSMTDTPEALRQAANACQNLGAWPVLVGAPGECDAMLASPIILYDYPEIAPRVRAISLTGRKSMNC